MPSSAKARWRREAVRPVATPNKKKTPTSEGELAENKLAKKLSEHKSTIQQTAEVWQKLLLLSGAPLPAAPPAKRPSIVQDVVEAIRELGRIPKRNQGTSEEERAENKLAKRFSDHRDHVPDDVLQELRALRGASQPAEDEQLVAEASDPSHLPTEVDAAAHHARGAALNKIRAAALIQSVKDAGCYPDLQRDIIADPTLWN